MSASEVEIVDILKTRAPNAERKRPLLEMHS
jgi:hypothetical protein